MTTFTIAGRTIELEPERIEEVTTGLLPAPLKEHYVVVAGRRFPPKQVLSAATGLDLADFTTHQARRVLKRLGFVAARVGSGLEPFTPEPAAGPRRGRQAAVLAPHVGKWVAMAGPETVLVSADTPEDVLAWLARHERRAPYGMFRVPADDSHLNGAAPL